MIFSALSFFPVGAITVGGKLPKYLEKDLEGAKSVGEKMEPNFETLLQLKPDVITSSTKFPAETAVFYWFSSYINLNFVKKSHFLE
ncbi:ABC transporter substrate-binding protein [Bacillus sp. D-CC]